MSHPAVCGFTNVPIRNGDEVAYMVIAPRENSCGIGIYPFDFYTPVTPFVFGTWMDDGLVELDDVELEKLTTYFQLLAAETSIHLNPEDNCDLAPGYYPFMIRRDAFEMMNQLEYMHWDGNHFSDKTFGFLREHQKTTILPKLKLAIKAAQLEHLDELERHKILLMDPIRDGMDLSSWYCASQGPFDFLKYMMSFAEGQYPPACNIIAKQGADYARQEDATVDGLLAVLEPYFDIDLLWGAMNWSRRSIFPHYIVGPQETMAQNHVIIGKFIAESSARVLAEEISEDSE